MIRCTPIRFLLRSFTTFGDLLKYLRRREHLTQLELSIKVGYSEAQISRLEKNQRLPDPHGCSKRSLSPLCILKMSLNSLPACWNWPNPHAQEECACTGDCPL